MIGEINGQASIFSRVDFADCVGHPILKIRRIVEKMLVELEPGFDAIDADRRQPSIPPEQLLRALLLQILFTICSERLLVERIDCDLLFR